MLEMLWKEHDDRVTESVTIIGFHVALDSKALGHSVKHDLELDLIPEDHWRHFVVVFGRGHNLVSGVVDLLLQLGDVFRLDDLDQFFLAFVTKFFDFDERVSFALDFADEVFLVLNALGSETLEILDRILVNFKTMAHRSPFRSLNKFLSLATNLLFISHNPQIYINIILPQS